MKFSAESSPHIRGGSGVSRVMQQVLLALIPGAAAMIYFFGWGVVVNLVLANFVALAAEALMLRWRGRAIKPHLGDYSAVVTASLLALALPPLAPWWLTTIAVLFAIILAKHLYGGLGFNPFNPAMVGYVVVLISFPREMTQWVLPSTLNANLLGLTDTLNLVLFNTLPANLSLDAITSATTLDAVKIQLSLDQPISSLFTDMNFSVLFGSVSGIGWEWINGLYLLGGLWLLYRGIIGWQIPAAMIASIALMASLFYVIDNQTYLSPMMHVFSGGFMLAAFFIATDPVTASTTPRGRLVFGAGIGLLVYIIRSWGGYPDGIAFAVLLMNMAAPLIDHYTTPRAYGETQ